MKQFPQDSGSGLPDQADRDWGDAAHFGALAHSGIEGILVGCGLTADFTVPEVTVASGMVRIVDTDVASRDHTDSSVGPGTGVVTWAEIAQAYRVDQTTVALTDGAVNEIFIAGDQSSPDAATVVATSDGSVPAGPTIKIGEVDTGADTTSERWYLISRTGQLSFPDESAALEASNDLSNGVVYERANSEYYKVT